MIRFRWNVFLDFNVQISQVTKDDSSGLLSVAVEKIGGNDIVHIDSVDEVLLAIGRNPNTSDLNLPYVVSSIALSYT